MLEEREFETRTDQLKMTVKRGGGQLGWLRCSRDGVTRRVFAITRRQQRHRALVGRVARLVNALVELRRCGEHQREEECADNSRDCDRA